MTRYAFAIIVLKAASVTALARPHGLPHVAGRRVPNFLFLLIPKGAKQSSR